MAYGLYTFKMVACSKNKQCSSSEISLMAAQSATMCNVLLDSYVELEPVIYFILTILIFIITNVLFFLIFRQWSMLRSVIFHQVHRQ